MLPTKQTKNIDSARGKKNTKVTQKKPAMVTPLVPKELERIAWVNSFKSGRKWFLKLAKNFGEKEGTQKNYALALQRFCEYIGKDPDTAAAIESMGGRHAPCTVDMIHLDRQNNIVTTPAYMLGPGIKDVAQGIENLVAQIMEMLPNSVSPEGEGPGYFKDSGGYP